MYKLLSFVQKSVHPGDQVNVFAMLAFFETGRRIASDHDLKNDAELKKS